ncbi:MAG: sensor N-terminal transmembrane domain-containing protein [Acidobacteriota bacterium]|nr:sensor N-terminal transmembrane domain-containing protein [Acidobacteriota bacterium]
MRSADAGAGRRRGRLTIRLLAFNLLLVFIPAAGFLYLDVYEKQLLEAQESSMVQQGRVVSAALAERSPLLRDDVEPLLVRLNRRLESRIRVVDGEGRLLGDSSRIGPRLGSAPAAAQRDASAAARRPPLYRVGAWIYLLTRKVFPPPEPAAADPPEPVGTDGRLRGREIESALAGKYGRAVRSSAPRQRSVTLFSAIPVTAAGRVSGAVLVSQSTYRILQDLYAVRLGIFKVCLGSLAAAALLSLLVSMTIAKPIRELRDEAEAILDGRGRIRGRFRKSSKPDEIGDLSRTLHELTRRLEEYQRFLESFAAEVAHEFKNPLASIRTAAELLSETEDPAERLRFVRMVQGEVVRMERLLSDLKEMTLIDAQLEAEDQGPVSLTALLEKVCEGYRLRGSRVRFTCEAPAQDVTVRASGERLAQVFENLLDNAESFSPDGGTVRVRLELRDGAAVATVRDEGPGIPPEHLPKIFERFFTWRPQSPAGAARHTGLGLAIVRTIVEGYGGTVTASNPEGGGAEFAVKMPASRTGVFRKA